MFSIFQGLWSLIKNQSSISISETKEDAVVEPYRETEIIDGSVGSKNVQQDRVRSYTYEKRNITQSDIEQLSKKYDIVIIAAGAGEKNV